MRTSFLTIITAILTLPTNAQLAAGEVPDGMIAIETNIDIVLTDPFTEDSADLELDCDDFMDLQAVLYRGAPEIDGPNTALLRTVDDDLEFCTELAVFPRPAYYSSGELLTCPSGYDWQSSEELVLGDFGGFTAIGPVNIDDMYIAYRRATQVGWIRLSFDVQGGLDPVHLQVHEVLPLCPTTLGVDETIRDQGFSLFPNPSEGGPIRVECNEVPRNIEVIGLAGKVIARYVGQLRTIPSPSEAGAYLVRVNFPNGRSSLARLLRY